MIRNGPEPQGQGPFYCHEGLDSLCQRQLDGLIFYYHRPSGITHIVDNPVPEILSVLGEELQSLHQIGDRLCALYDMEDRQAMLSALAEHLEHMAGLGLARRVWPIDIGVSDARAGS